MQAKTILNNDDNNNKDFILRGHSFDNLS